jgi:hypothetical protein
MNMAVFMLARYCKRQTKPISRVVLPRRVFPVLNCHREPVNLHQSAAAGRLVRGDDIVQKMAEERQDSRSF